MGIRLESDIAKVTNQLSSVVGAIEKGLLAAMEEIRDVTTEAVTDNKNWNPKAVYKGGPQKGQRYDLNFTGSLLSTIRNKQLNSIVVDKNTIRLGIGHIPSLDAIPTMRGRNPHGGYWRVVVYGRASISGYTFWSDGSTWSINPLKTKGWAVRSVGKKIDKSEPTYMFENGLSAAKGKYPEIVSRHIGQAVKR